MTQVELAQLVREAVREALAPPPRRALVLFSGGLLGFEESIGGLRMLVEAGVVVDYVQTPSALKILDQQLIASIGMREVSKRMVEAHDLLIAPTMTSNIAAKVAHGVADCLASNLFSEFIMSNRLVVASRTAICPDDAAKQSWFPQMPAAYADMLRGNLAALASFGVRLCSAHALGRTALAAWDRRDLAHRERLAAQLGVEPATLPRWQPPSQPTASAPAGAAQPASQPPASGSVVHCHRSLVSQQVIQQLPHGTDLRIGARASVTAMARDLAAARSIRISREV
ncbi:MAG: flavoprotein [Propionicimonas sp.]